MPTKAKLLLLPLLFILQPVAPVAYQVILEPGIDRSVS